VRAFAISSFMDDYRPSAHRAYTPPAIESLLAAVHGSPVVQMLCGERLRQAPLVEARDEGVAFVLDLTERPRMLRCLRLRQILANKAFLLRLRSSGAKSKLQPTLRSSGARVDRFSVHEVQVPGPRYPQTTVSIGH
jgi:hypothetical protein